MLQTRLAYNAERPYHKDVTILVDDLIVETQDTYFFLLDNFILPDEENWDKVKIVFHFLLSQWQITISNLPNNKVDYLPFDFSDQYIGCFKITDLADDLIDIRYGFTTKFDGTTLCPSQIDLFKLEVNEFIISSRHPNSIVVNKNRIIRDIEAAKNSIIQYNS